MNNEKENAVMAIPSEKNFSLEKVKLGKDGGLEAQYEIVEVRDNESYVNNYHVSNSIDVHPDLANLFKDLRPIVARTFGMTSFLSMLESPDMKLPESKLLAARTFANEILNNIEVRGVSYSGKDENVGVVITAVYTTSNGLKTCINTPRLKMATISFGFEEELEAIVGKIEREVYAFLFEGKQAQLSLFGADGNVNPDITDADLYEAGVEAEIEANGDMPDDM